MKNLRSHLELLKIPMSLLITLSAVFGYMMHSETVTQGLIFTAAGILMLACGGACLNNYQDRHFDRLFSRTRHRALPSRTILPNRALTLSAFLIISGTVLLYFVRYNPVLPLIGAFAIFLYNGIYTPLKPRTALAIVPGALCGTMPPLIGWTAAGGNPFSLKIISIMVLLGIWQFPHFWLILLNHCPEYRRVAVQGMLMRLNRSQLEKIVFIWIANFAVMLVFIPLLYWGIQGSAGWLFVVAALVLVSVTFLNIFPLVFRNNYYFLFRLLNGTVFFFMIVFIFRRLI